MRWTFPFKLAGLLLVASVVNSPLVEAGPSRPDRATKAKTARSTENAGSGPSGAAAFKKYCALCHGADGRGYAADNAPSLINPSFLESADDLFLRRSIELGRPGTPMAGYGTSVGGPLTPEAIQELVAYLRARTGIAAKVDNGSSPPRPAGDSRLGANLYAAQCQRCHGDWASRGSAPQLLNPTFLSLASDDFLRHAILKGRPETAMESFRGSFTDSQVDDLIAYLRSQAKSAPRPSLTRTAPPTDSGQLIIHPKGKAPDFQLREGRYVPAVQVRDALAAGRRMIIVDARAPSDFLRSHIPGAISGPYYDKETLDRIPNDGTWVVAYCACPHHASGEVVDALRARGIQNSAILDEGILVWEQLAYPIVHESGTPTPSAP